MFHVYRIIFHLPAKFQDGICLNDKIYPWMLTIWVDRYVFLLKENRTWVSLIRDPIVIGLGWVSTPLLLFFIWVRYWVSQDTLGSYFQFVVIVLSIFSAGIFLYLVKRTVQEKTKWNIDSFWKIFCNTIYTLGIIGFCGFIPVLIEKDNYFEKLKKIDFSYQDISIKPEKWDPNNRLLG